MAWKSSGMFYWSLILSDAVTWILGKEGTEDDFFNMWPLKLFDEVLRILLQAVGQLHLHLMYYCSFKLYLCPSKKIIYDLHIQSSFIRLFFGDKPQGLLEFGALKFVLEFLKCHDWSLSEVLRVPGINKASEQLLRTFIVLQWQTEQARNLSKHMVAKKRRFSGLWPSFVTTLSGMSSNCICWLHDDL